VQALLPVHVIAGGLALVLGAVALYATKGAGLHRRFGLLFVLAMLTMALSGATIAAAHRQEASVVAGLLTAYLVVTALITIRPRSRSLDVVLMLAALSIGLVSLTWGFDAILNGSGGKSGIPAPIFFVFGSVALIGSGADLRMIRSGGVQGRRRLARHLWRMCFAFWIASASFFLGQAEKFPEALRIFPLLMSLAFFPLIVMLYWLWRVRWRGSFRGIVVRPPLEEKRVLPEL
jgi:hypothetical protein